MSVPCNPLLLLLMMHLLVEITLSILSNFRWSHLWVLLKNLLTTWIVFHCKIGGVDVWYSVARLYCTMPCYIILHYTALHYAVLHCLYYTALNRLTYCTLQFYTILNPFILWYTNYNHTAYSLLYPLIFLHTIPCFAITIPHYRIQLNYIYIKALYTV